MLRRLVLTALFIPTIAFAKTVQVGGQGSVQAEPDLVFVNVSLSHRDMNAKKDQEQVAKAHAGLVEALQSFGLSKDSYPTVNFAITPIYRYGGSLSKTGKPQFEGFEVSHQVEVEFKETAKIGRLLDKVAGLSSEAQLRIDGLNWQVKQHKQFELKALNLAVADCKTKAEVIADAAGSKLGPVDTLRHGFSHSPIPMSHRGAMEMAVAGSAAPTNINPKALEISAHVDCVYSLN